MYKLYIIIHYMLIIHVSYTIVHSQARLPKAPGRLALETALRQFVDNLRVPATCCRC